LCPVRVRHVEELVQLRGGQDVAGGVPKMIASAQKDDVRLSGAERGILFPTPGKLL